MENKTMTAQPAFGFGLPATGATCGTGIGMAAAHSSVQGYVQGTGASTAPVMGDVRDRALRGTTVLAPAFVVTDPATAIDGMGPTAWRPPTC